MRVLILWTRPYHLSADEAQKWMRAVTAFDVVERAVLTRLASASERQPSPHDWMLELRLKPGATASQCVESWPCREWLGDLRLLGMRPVVLVANGGQLLAAEAAG